MAFNLRITAARATSVQIQADGASGYTLLISYRLCIGGTANTMPDGGSGKDKGAAAYEDVVVGKGERMMAQALSKGSPMPVPAELAALVRQDCAAVYGGQPDAVLIGGMAV